MLKLVHITLWVQIIPDAMDVLHVELKFQPSELFKGYFLFRFYLTNFCKALNF